MTLSLTHGGPGSKAGQGVCYVRHHEEVGVGAVSPGRTQETTLSETAAFLEEGGSLQKPLVFSQVIMKCVCFVLFCFEWYTRNPELGWG